MTAQAELVSLKGISDRVSSNSALIPSLAYVENASTVQVAVGQQVRDRGLDIATDPRFFRGFKRGIGAAVQGFLPTLDGQTLSFEQVGAWYLHNLVTQLRQTDPEAARSLVLTVPVDSFEAYRQWLGQVCQSLQVEQVRLIDEPTAAALGYGVADQNLLLVVDFGGGTLDLSLVQLDLPASSSLAGSQPLGFILKWGEKFLGDNQNQSHKTARVLAKAGQPLGGTDIDNWLVDYFVKQQACAITPLTLRLAERLKIQLSQHSQASEVYFDEANFETLEFSLDRETFSQILAQHQFLPKLEASMTELLQQARRSGISPTDIDSVLLVGGTSQMPIVQTWLQDYFPVEKIRSHRPFAAVAEGALQLTQGIELKDFLYHSYGIRYWDRRQNAHNWHPLIRAGQAYPMREPVELVLGASVSAQPSIELIIGELGRETTGTEVFFDGDRLITRSYSSQQSQGQQVQALNDREGSRQIAQLSPLGQPGSDRIKVQFWVDSNCQLRISVDDLLTQERLLSEQVVAQLS